MTPFELAEPRSLADALALLDRDDPAVRPIAGGTALMLMMKSGLYRPIRLVSLRGIEPRFRRIEVASNGILHIGAMATLAAIEHSAAVAAHSPALVRAMRTLANVRVRNAATLGGALAHADPHLDLPPLLIALGAKLVISSRNGERNLRLDALYTGYFETVLRHDEIISEVTIPAADGRRTVYFKCTTRSADDWPALGIAINLFVADDAITDARVVIGAATEKPMHLAGAEAVLRGTKISDALLARAGDAAAKQAPVETDDRGSSAYKRQLIRVTVTRALKAALAGAA
jgi:aerobic carbon-monoxide dehydrogenase medium subunit